MSVPNGKSACAEREPALQELLFGDLSAPERKELEHHLTVCSRCSRALDDARRGLAALSILDQAPLPFHERQVASEELTSPEAAWVDFESRLKMERHREGKRTILSAAWWLLRGAAAAALLILGIGIGRWGAGPREAGVTAPPVQKAGLEELTIEAQAVEALTRAELLSDVGLGYVNGLQDLLQRVLDTPAGSHRPATLASTREEALELIRDGRLLRRSLDPERDAAFLSTINRAEVYLEELAALESDSTGRGVELIQATLQGSRLLFQIARLNVEKEVNVALEASGWIGEELAQRKEF